MQPVLRVVVQQVRVEAKFPYVEIEWNGSVAMTKPTAERPPTWRQEYDFPVEEDDIADKYTLLDLRVYDAVAPGARAREVGTCSIGISQLMQGEEFTHWYPLENGRGSAMVKLLALGFGITAPKKKEVKKEEAKKGKRLQKLVQSFIVTTRHTTGQMRKYYHDLRTGLPLTGVPERFRAQYPALAPCAIFYFSLIDKISPRGKLQPRLLVVTDEAVYSALQSGKVKRCIRIGKIDSILTEDREPDKNEKPAAADNQKGKGKETAQPEEKKKVIALISLKEYDYPFVCPEPNTFLTVLRQLHLFHYLRPLVEEKPLTGERVIDIVQHVKPPRWEMNFLPPTTKKAWMRKIGEYAQDVLQQVDPPAVRQRQNPHAQLAKLRAAKAAAAAAAAPKEQKDVPLCGNAMPFFEGSQENPTAAPPEPENAENGPQSQPSVPAVVTTSKKEKK